MTNTNAEESVAQRLRLKRWFLRTLVISLVFGALVAVLTLLLGNFGKLTARVLLTLGGLALHSGIAMACVTTLERQQWPRLSVWGLVAFGLNFCVLVGGIWWPGGPDEPALYAVLTTLVLIGYYLTAIPCGDLHERRQWSPLPLAGLAACAVGFAAFVVCLWSEAAWGDWFERATGIAAVLAFSLAHTCLLVRVPGGSGLTWIFRGTLACVWAMALMAVIGIEFEPREELFYRVLGAVGVLDGCGSLSLLIIAKLRGVEKVEGFETTSATIEIHCPRCTMQQTVVVGASSCEDCGLKFRIDIEEPRCAKCGYLLWQLPERRCPECGTTF